MTASGSSQSPIDFCEREITFVNPLPRIRFSYPRETDVTLVNTGSPEEFKTIRANVAPGAAFITLSDTRYDLLQFHWHTPSEHEIEGRRTPLEMHFVHQGADSSLLVIAVFIEQGDSHNALDPIFRHLPEHPDDTRDVPGIHLAGLLPHQHESFRYSGSLTTPPFDEGVRFIVFTEPIRLAKRWIGAFQKLFPNGNHREIQPLNGRQVRSDAHHT